MHEPAKHRRGGANTRPCTETSKLMRAVPTPCHPYTRHAGHRPKWRNPHGPKSVYSGRRDQAAERFARRRSTGRTNRATRVNRKLSPVVVNHANRSNDWLCVRSPKQRKHIVLEGKPWSLTRRDVHPKVCTCTKHPAGRDRKPVQDRSPVPC